MLCQLKNIVISSEYIIYLHQDAHFYPIVLLTRFLTTLVRVDVDGRPKREHRLYYQSLSGPIDLSNLEFFSSITKSFFDMTVVNVVCYLNGQLGHDKESNHNTISTYPEWK